MAAIWSRGGGGGDGGVGMGELKAEMACCCMFKYDITALT